MPQVECGAGVCLLSTIRGNGIVVGGDSEREMLTTSQ